MAGGVLALNLLFLVAGSGVLHAARGWETWRAFLGDLGLSYILGLGAVGVAANLVLVAGGSLSTPAILGLTLGLFAAGAVLGTLRHRPLPRRFGDAWSRPRTIGDLLAAVAAAVCWVVVLLLYRAFRQQPLTAYDAWNFWIPKAKIIYFFNGIDHHVFGTLPAPSYPLFVPSIDAMVFRLTHSTDATALAQQWWIVLAGFIGAAASLLAPIARRGLVWLFLACLVVIPELILRWFQLLADWTLDSFLIVAMLLAARWLVTRERWLLMVLPIPLAALLITKREGQLLLVCFVVGFLAATMRERRRVWPWIGGLAVGAFVVSQLPWRLWWMSHHYPSDLHEGGTGYTGSLHRAFASAHVVAELVFSYRMWFLAVPVALLACAAVLVARRDPRQSIFFLVTGVTAFIGFTWVMWSDSRIPLDTNPALNPTPREVASIASLSLLFSPILLSQALAGERVPWLEAAPLAAWRNGLPRLRAWVTTARPSRILGALVVAQWVLVLGLASRVRHASWIFYQGGDQLWYYTIGWSLAHGHFPQPGVGYLWAVLLAPIAAVTGPNIANAYPAIVVVQFLFLLPVALLALYGIAARIGGRLFGYWTALLWLIVPLVAIRYTDAGYHARFTEALLPQGFGLTAMGDFPSMVATIVSCYFCARVIAGEPRRTANAIAAGLAGGAAFAVKPATALFLAGPILGLLVARRYRATGWFAAALVPAAVALAFVKWRGFGYVPLFHAAAGMHLAAGGGPTVLAADPLQHYLHFNWHIFLTQLDQVREHFWSVRVVEWLVLGGVIALFVKSRPFGALVVGWFFPLVILKAGSGRADFEGGSLLRVLMPAYPAFALMIAALPFLVPGVARRWTGEPPPSTRPFLSARARTTALVAAVLGTAVVPMAAWAVAKPIRSGPPVLRAAILQQPPIPLGVDIGLRARRTAKSVTLTWRAQHPAGGPVFYTIFRRQAGTTLYSCNPGSAAQYCALTLTNLGTTHATTWSDPKPLAGSASYYVGVTANWLNDLTQGDVYVLSSGAQAP